MWLTFLACAHRAELDLSGGARLSHLRREGLAVMETVLVRDLPAPPLGTPPPPGEIEARLGQESFGAPTLLDPVRDAAYLRNDYVGIVLFGGGLIRSGTGALEVRARLLEFHGQEELAIQGRAWLDGAVARAAEQRGLDIGFVPARGDFVVEREPVRGLHPDDGRDNINLPRTRLRFGPLPEGCAADGQGWLLVPFLRQYYVHNGGWFIGQRWGTMAGARVEAWLVLYDLDGGPPVWTFAATGRQFKSSTGQASRSELDQLLLDAEEDLAAALEHKLFR